MQNEFGAVCSLVWVSEYPHQFIDLFDKLRKTYGELCQIDKENRTITLMNGFDRFEIFFPLRVDRETLKLKKFYYILRSGYGEISENEYLRLQWAYKPALSPGITGGSVPWDDFVEGIECILKS